MANDNTQYYGMVTDNLGWGVDQITFKQNSDGTYTVTHDIGTMSNAGDHYISTFGYPQAFNTESEALSYIQTKFPSAQKVDSPLYIVKEETVSIGSVSFTNTKQTSNEEAISNLCRQVNNSSTSSSQSSSTSSQPAIEPVPVESAPKTDNQLQSQPKSKPLISNSPDVLEEINREATPVNSSPSSSPSSNSSSYNFYFGDGQYTPKLGETSSLQDSLMNPKFDGTEVKNLGRPNINLEVPDIRSSSHKESSTSPKTSEVEVLTSSNNSKGYNQGTGITSAEQENRELTGIKNQYGKTIQDQAAVIDDQAKVINSQKGTITGLTGKTEDQNQTIRELTGDLNQAKSTINDQAHTIDTLEFENKYKEDLIKAEAYDRMYAERIATGNKNQTEAMHKAELAAKEAEKDEQLKNTNIALQYAQDQVKAQQVEDMYAARIAQGNANQSHAAELTEKDKQLKNTNIALQYAQDQVAAQRVEDMYAARIAQGNANQKHQSEVDKLETDLLAAQLQNESLFAENQDLHNRFDRLEQYEDNLNFIADYEERVAMEDEATRQTTRALTLREDGKNTSITKLIDSGADAQVNLFEVSIYAGKKQTEFSSIDKTELHKNLTFRITAFNAPEKQLQVQDLVYQAGSFPKVMVSSGLTRQLDFTVRIDSNYEIYWFMHDIYAGDSTGNFDLNLFKSTDNPYLSKIIVKALKPNPMLVLSDSDNHYQTTDGYDVIYSWTFSDCILTKIPQVALDMGNSGPITGVYSFKFGAMHEGLGPRGLDSFTDTETHFSVMTRDSLLEESRGSFAAAAINHAANTSTAGATLASAGTAI